MQYLLHNISSTCFGLIHPSSGASRYYNFLHIQHMVSLVLVLRSVCTGGVLHCWLALMSLSVYTLKDISDSQECLCHLLRKHYITLSP